MKLNTRCIPYGALPYETIESATRSIAKLFDKTPFIPFLPKLDSKDSIERRSLINIPGVCISDDNAIVLKFDNSYEEKMKLLDKAYNSPTKENLEEFGFEAPFLEKFLQMIKKFKSPHAFINILGPFTISQIIMNAAETQIVADKSYRKLYVQAVCVKALWLIDKISEYCKTTVPIVILEEPMLNKLGDLKRKNGNNTVDLITNIFTKVIDKIKSAGGIVCVQCFEKCDWHIPINAGADIISFDAYNNPNNMNIASDALYSYISCGGKINWGIVPVVSEAMLKTINLDYLKQRLCTTMDGLVMAGIPQKFVYNSALVSIQGNMDNMPLIFAEKAMLTAIQLSKAIPVIS